MMYHPTIEAASFGNLPQSVRPCCLVRKSKRAGLTENPPPPHSVAAQDWKQTGILTGATLNCGPLPSSHPRRSVIASKTSGRGGQQSGAAAGLLMNTDQNCHVLMSCQKFKKIWIIILQE